MKLHLNKELFNDAVRITAQQMDINPIYVEKDYWVTLREPRLPGKARLGHRCRKHGDVNERFRPPQLDIPTRRSRNQT